MIDLYALTSPNVQKIFIGLEELELPYRVIPVDVWQAEQFKPEFLRLNPNGKIPVIVDHDGPGGKPYTCFESGAILLYLADKTGKLLPKDTAQRFDVIQWLMVQMSGVGPMSGQLVHFKRFAPEVIDYAVSRYQTELRRLYDVLETRLGQAAYLGGAEYSVADVATFPWARNHDFLGVKWDDHPNCARWFGAIAERPAVKRALAKVDAIQSVRDKAKPDDVDRFFGRGRYARV
jgi:GSH-dependent disulfide-bond oxidoreductase